MLNPLNFHLDQHLSANGSETSRETASPHRSSQLGSTALAVGAGALAAGLTFRDQGEITKALLVGAATTAVLLTAREGLFTPAAKTEPPQPPETQRIRHNPRKIVDAIYEIEGLNKTPQNRSERHMLRDIALKTQVIDAVERDTSTEETQETFNQKTQLIAAQGQNHTRVANFLKHNEANSEQFIDNRDDTRRSIASAALALESDPMKAAVLAYAASTVLSRSSVHGYELDCSIMHLVSSEEATAAAVLTHGASSILSGELPLDAKIQAEDFIDKMARDMDTMNFSPNQSERLYQAWDSSLGTNYDVIAAAKTVGAMSEEIVATEAINTPESVLKQLPEGDSRAVRYASQSA